MSRGIQSVLEVIQTISPESPLQTSEVEASKSTKTSKLTQPASEEVREVGKETWQAATLLDTLILFLPFFVFVKRPKNSLLL